VVSQRALQRVTLFVTKDTVLAQVVSQLVSELETAGIANPALGKLVGDAAARLQQQLQQVGMGPVNAAPIEPLHGKTVLRVPGAVVTVTTQPPGALQRLFARISPHAGLYS